VHIDEVADIYTILFDAIRANPDGPGHGWSGFYFGESGEHTMFDVAVEIGRVLVALGKARDATPTTFTSEEVDKYFAGSTYLGTNGRCRAERARQLGWKPVRTTKDLIASLQPEIERILASGNMKIELR
jgi:nucleoside-diphosphate-sugar epimerase